MSMEKRNVIEENRTPGFVKTAVSGSDDFEKRAKAAFGAFKERKPKPAKKPGEPNHP